MIKGVAMTGGKRTLILGLTGEVMDKLLKQEMAMLVELEGIEELRNESPERVILAYAETDHDLMELIAPHLDPEATVQGSTEAL